MSRNDKVPWVADAGFVDPDRFDTGTRFPGAF